VIPHPAFAGREIPREAAVGGLRLVWLTPGDLDEDYAAVMESEADLVAAFGGPWPKGLTREADAVDLAWHRREFEAARSFAWVIRDPGDGAYLGCAYVYLGWSEAGPMIPWWWFRTSAAGRAEAAGFGAAFLGWLAGPPWPALAVDPDAPKG